MNNSILIAEDEGIIALDLKNLLTKSGYRNISIVRDGDSLVRKTMEMVPSLIISDIYLKGKTDGLNAALKIKEKQNKIPFIFISGVDITEKQIDLLNYEVIKKPFRQEDLLKAVKKFLT